MHKVKESSLGIIQQYFHMVKAAWTFAEEKRWQMIFFYFLTSCASIIYMMQPYIIGKFINAIQNGGDKLLDNVLFYLGLYASTTLLFWAFHGPSRVIENCLAYDIRRNLINFYYDVLGKMPLSWHHEHHSGNTINRINKAAMSLDQFSSHQFKYIEIIIRPIITLIMLAIIDIYVMWAGLILAVIIVTYMVYLDKKIVRQIFLVNEKEHVLSAKFFDYISNMFNVVGFNLQNITKGVLNNSMKNIYPHVRHLNIISEWKWCGKMISVSIGIFLILYGYISYHETNNIPFLLGTVIMIFQYLERMDRTLSKMAEVFNQLATQYTDYTSVNPIRDDYLTYQVSYPEGTKQLVAPKGKVSFKNIDFKYHENIDVFKDLNLEIKSHEKIGLVGISGAGKTTLINLLLRSYRINKGSITIDDQDIYKSTSQSVIEHISLIPQDISLFEENVIENIRYGRKEATDDEVIAAAQKAHADTFIELLPNKYETLVGERGVRLSGGQRQRVAIARAILKNSPILILDEATSALDSESEAAIQDSLNTVMKGKTVIAIAHRLSTLAHMDRIIVMDKGKIIETGSHSKLLEKKSGVYARLWHKQSGGFLQEG